MMDNPKLNFQQASENGREPKGLEDCGTEIIRCEDCGQNLMTVQIVKNDAIKTRVLVRCGLCGGKSFVREILGQFYPGVVDDTLAFDVKDAEAGTHEVEFVVWKKD